MKAVRSIDLTRMHVPSGGGERIPVFGHEVTFKVTSEMSGGAYFVFEVLSPPGTGVPLHRHTEEFFHAIEGELVFQIDDERFMTGPGDVLNVPAGRFHGFRVRGETPARSLFMLALGPGNDFETMFRATEGLDHVADWETLKAVQKGNVEFLEPQVMPEL